MTNFRSYAHVKGEKLFSVHIHGEGEGEVGRDGKNGRGGMGIACLFISIYC